MVMKAIHILVEHPEYIELLFSVAEELYLNGLVEESLLFMRKSLRRESIMNRIGWPSVIIEFSGRVSELMPKKIIKQ
ncbi:hypothetical protein P7H17_07840 [Paenibacillus larvae]|nr:hypothetical protein [Paenibacillus larvae]MDT2286025.1 hypothetical protein [Paenibacillus larvae]